jgi:putative sugar O-methyltransferase
MSRFAHILQFVQAEIARRDAAPAGVLTPSDYWKDFNAFSSYVRTLPDEELRFVRRHTWHLTGDRYDYYHFISNRFRRQIIAQYESTLPLLGGFRPSEPADGIGVDTPYGRLNSGILRYSVVMGDLLQSGLLSREGAPGVLEIGGGYGGLALMAMQFNPHLSWVICDLEESLFIQGVFLTQHLGEARVKLGVPKAAEPGTVYLVPQTRAGELAGLRFDFAVNQQSMQEMTLAQVEHYSDLLEKCAERFYSCNRKSHGAGIVRDKGLVADLHQALARRFEVLWDSTDSLPALARLCMRHKVARKLITAFIGKSFMPVGEASLRRFVYRCRRPA